MTGTGTRVAQLAIVVVVTVVAVIVGWFVLVAYPNTLAELFGVVLLIGVALLAIRIAGNVAGSLFPNYNVAEVAVEGTITRDGGSGILRSPTGTVADDIVEQIDRANAERSVDALLMKLNTPGGEIVPSEDIRLAAEGFDGPTIAYATDVCASGGYDIAAGCDELWAREGSIVGSIGVIGSRVNVAGLADRLGVDYERFAGGKYKDAGIPLKELDADERAYLQHLIDDHYDQFVDIVADGRGLDEETIRDTEARVYLGERAKELGLVDGLGTREDVEDRVEDLLDRSVVVEEFEPEQGLARRLRGGAQAVAFALGAGVSNPVSGDVDGLSFRK